MSVGADPAALLSREELAALLQGARDGSPAPAVRGSGVAEIGRGELRELASRFAAEQGRSLSTLYQTSIRLQLSYLEEITLRQFAAAMLATDRVARLDLGGGREAYLLLPRPLAFAWMMLAFGARPGQGPELVLGRSYTRIELRFLSRAAEGVASTLAKALDSGTSSEVKVLALEDPVALYDRSKRPHRVLSIEVEGLGETSSLRIALPLSLVEDSTPDAPVSSGEPSLEMAEQLFETPVDLRVEIGSTQVGLQELSRLAVGDALRLEPASGDSSLLVNVESAPRFRAEPGKLGKRRAIRITDVIHP